MRRSRFVVIVALLTALVFCMETCVVSAASLKEVRKSTAGTHMCTYWPDRR